MALSSASSLAIVGFSLITISLIFLVIGFTAVHNNRFHIHKYFMLFAFFSNAFFLIFYIIRYLKEGNTPFPGPKWFSNFVYVPVLIIHILTALFSIYFVFRQIITGWKGQKLNSHGNLTLIHSYRDTHVKFGKKAVLIWGISFLGGIFVFFMLYVIF
ncbi:MAG: DUF420 domain-containing protein [Candidatus Kariarchaeaceae archaeon]|jgi:uncharacterized membrane protein YozB (DUF420 family)